MPNYQAITKQAFADLRWKRFDNYRFAARDAVVPLVVQELPEACIRLPVVFIEQGDRFAPAALQGLRPGHNLLVAPDGRWLNPYIPAAYRGHPFALAQTESDQTVLCIDRDSGLVGEHYAEPFFDEDGEPAPAVKRVLAFLHQTRANRTLTDVVCAALQAEGVIVPWPLTIKSVDGEHVVKGLHCIDEARFNRLDFASIRRLREAGALPVVYCQLLSMQHLKMLGELAQARMKPGARSRSDLCASDELDLEFLNNSGTLSFGSH